MGRPEQNSPEEPGNWHVGRLERSDTYPVIPRATPAVDTPADRPLTPPHYRSRGPRGAESARGKAARHFTRVWALSLLVDGTPPCEGGSRGPMASGSIVQNVVDRPPVKAARPLQTRSARPCAGVPRGPGPAILGASLLGDMRHRAVMMTRFSALRAARRAFERGAAVGGWRGRYSRGSATTSQR